jgi:amylosucrase
MPPVPPGAGWATYVRCHDDIGWAITEEDAAAAGEDGYQHRRFLASFYAGDFPGSFARGARFQDDPRTGEARTSGTAASLAGIEAALEAGDDAALDLAIRRVLLLHAVAFAHGGLPLLYMGDELGLRNDRAWAESPDHAADNRWMHRPAMDWDAAERRADRTSVEGRLWWGLQRLAAARKRSWAAHAAGAGEAVWTGNDHVFGLVRQHAGEKLLLLGNFSAGTQAVHRDVFEDRHLELREDAGHADGRPIALEGDFVVLEPYQFAWMSGPEAA